MEECKKYLIIGLGNAENKYAGTRHNIGFEVATALARTFAVNFRSDRYAYIAEMKWKGRTIIAAMPTTYMNLSGNAARYWLDKENIPVENMLIISDDIDLPVGVLRLKPKGGGGSHNGLNHIIETLKHSNFPRLRFGIGKNYAQGYQVEYVLGKFEREEFQTLIEPAIDKAVQLIKSFVTAGIARTMNQCNTNSQSPETP